MLEEYKIEKNDLEGLKEALESVLPRFMQFEAELDAGRLKAKSNCPIHGVYREWCERGCISMRESFVRVISEKIRVRRMHSAPVDKECVFEFSI